MPKREPKKCRQWERERRDRLKNSFDGLCKVLPSYDPSITVSKLDILKGATHYIKELRTLNQKVIRGDKNLHDDLKTDLQMLDTRVEKLIRRNEQLVGLLQNAGIKIPTELKGDKEFSKAKLWSNKITKEKAAALVENEKENSERKTTAKKIGTKLKAKLKIKINNENIVKKLKPSKKRKRTLKSKTVKILHFNNNAVATSPASSQLINVTCYSSTNLDGGPACNRKFASSNFLTPQQSILLNNPAISCKNAIVTNSTLLSAPIMATGLAADQSLASLGPGTIILANGNVFPLLHAPAAPATIIQPSTLLVTNAPPNNPTLLVVKPPTHPENDKKVKQYPRIAIKRPGITKTTTVNKVPIPALTSKFGLKKVFDKENQKKPPDEKKKDAKKLPAKRSAKSDSKKEEPKDAAKKLAKIVEPTIKAEVVDVKTTTEEKVPVSNYSVDSLCNSAKEVAPKIDAAKNVEKPAKVSSKEETVTFDRSISSPINSFHTGSFLDTSIKSTNFDPPTISQACNKSTNTAFTQNSISIQTTSSLTVCETASKTTSINMDQNLTLSLPPPDFSNDIFSTLHVPNGVHHHPESISPTAAFLLAFPLVSTLTGGKISENVDDESEQDSTPPTLLQIGNIESKQEMTFDIPNFYTSEKPSKSIAKKTPEKVTNPFNTPKAKPAKKEIKTANILDTLIPEIPPFQNHIFNYEHTPVTCPKPTDSMKRIENPSSSSMFPGNSSTEINYSENVYPISNSTSLSQPNVTYSNSITSMSSLNLQITKTTTPYISKITAPNYKTHYKRDEFKYPDFKLHENTVPASTQKPLVNWMTTPANDPKMDTFVPDFRETINKTSAKYFPANNKYFDETPEENLQYPWSTTNPNIPPSTLPMLMGDLALSTTTPTYTFGGKYETKDFQNVENDYYNKKNFTKQQTFAGQKEQGKFKAAENNQNSFLSVSQLVDRHKTDPTMEQQRKQARSKGPHVPKRASKTEQKSYNCSKEPTFLPIETSYETNWIKQPPAKNCSSTYSAEALIGSQNNYARNQYPAQQYPAYSNSKRLHPPAISAVSTFDPIGNQPFYEYPGQDTNYYPQNSANNGIYHHSNNFAGTTTNFPGNITDFETGDNYSFPAAQVKSCSKAKERKIVGPNPVISTLVKRNIKRKQNPMEASSSASTTALPGFSDLGFLSMSSTNSPNLLQAEDPFHVPNLFNTSNAGNVTQIYQNSYSKGQQNHDHLITTTYTSCNLLPSLSSSTSLPARNTLPPSQSMVSASPGITGNTLANFNLSTIFPEINKPTVSGGNYENGTYHHRQNLPNILPQQNCGNYSSL